MEFYLSFSQETQQYQVRFYNELGQDCLHSSFHKYEIARNTVKELQARIDAKEEA